MRRHRVVGEDDVKNETADVTEKSGEKRKKKKAKEKQKKNKVPYTFEFMLIHIVRKMTFP